MPLGVTHYVGRCPTGLFHPSGKLFNNAMCMGSEEVRHNKGMFPYNYGVGSKVVALDIMDLPHVPNLTLYPHQL